MSKTRAWCFTINNYTPEELKVCETVECEYICYEEEHVSEGTPHIQGYIYFSSPRYLRGVKRLLGDRCHLDAAKGSALQNKTYCGKEGKLVERGTMPQQGKRTDIEDVKTMLKAGAPLRDVIWACSNHTSMKVAEKLAEYAVPPERPEIKVHWYWGPPGCGKTRTAIEEAGPGYFRPVTVKWWDGYSGEKHVLIDDFKLGDANHGETFSLLLHILDRYAIKVQIKGGCVPLYATEIWVTSSMHPTCYVPFREDPGQLLRRISDLRFLGKEQKIGTEVGGVILSPPTYEGR